MSKHKITITDDGDETVFVKLNGEDLFEVDHDMYGWAGMEAVINAVTKLADATGVEVENTQDIV